MLAWLSVMRHPDGEIALFNDSAFGIAPTPAELEDYAARLDFPTAVRPSDGLTHLHESGYIRIQKDAAVLLLDVGPLGPDYLPAHGHADTLSFELSLHGQRVIVDTGVSRYSDGPVRLFERGTKAHNTVVVDGQDSSEVWGSFRVARRAKPFGLEIAEENGTARVECRHYGYRRLPGKVTHIRTWKLSSKRLGVGDRLEGNFKSARYSLLLHPVIADVSKDKIVLNERTGHGEWAVPGRDAILWKQGAGQGWHEEAEYHPEFGVSQKTVRLVGDFPQSRNGIELSWA
jgi:uncharacterized heparinase superfamily protein